MWFKRPTAEERIANRKRIHDRGVGRYIFFQGVLFYGTLTFLIELGWDFLFEHRPIGFAFLIGKAFQWGVAGLFFGWWTWRIEYDSDEEDA